MKRREHFKGVRLTDVERRTLDQIARTEERSPSDVLRRALRTEARRLGIVLLDQPEATDPTPRAA